MEKLYYKDSYISTFEAEVVSCNKNENGTYIITLSQTAFYPEGGGQPYDTGTLGGARVFEVHEKDGTVLHNTDTPLEPGAIVAGSIDWHRRFSHMQNHSGGLIFKDVPIITTYPSQEELHSMDYRSKKELPVKCGL